MAWVHRETFGQDLDSGVVDADPTAGAGLAAPVGSVALFGGLTYRKTGVGDTAWALLNVSGGDGISLNATTGVLDFDPDGTTLGTSGGQAVALVGQSYCAAGSNNADTTSTSHVLIQGAGSSEQMTITPGAGTYTVWLAVQCTVTAGPETVEIAIYNNGVLVPCSVLGRRVASSADIGAAMTIGRMTVGAGHAIEGRFRSIGGANARVTYRNLMAVRAS